MTGAKLVGWLLIVNGSAMADLPAQIMDHLQSPPLFKMVTMLAGLLFLLFSLGIYCMEGGQSQDGIEFAMFNSQIIRMEHANTEQELTNLENDPQIQDILKNTSEDQKKMKKIKKVPKQPSHEREKQTESSIGTGSEQGDRKDSKDSKQISQHHRIIEDVNGAAHKSTPDETKEVQQEEGQKERIEIIE